MKGDSGKEHPASEVVRTAPIQSTDEDWDATIRRAFLEGCVQQGVRARLSLELLESATGRDEQALRNAAADASRRASAAWVTIDDCLELYGKLAALALERCLEEASLQIRRSVPPSSSKVSSPPKPARESHALSVIAEGRARLARFWSAAGTSAA